MPRRLTTRFILLVLACVIVFTSVMVHTSFGIGLGKISIMAYPSTIKTGESTIINGSITDPIVNETQTIMLYYTIGNSTPYCFAEVTTDENETDKYSYNWTPPSRGTYVVKAGWTGIVNGTVYMAQNSTLVYVKAPPVAYFTPPTPPTPKVDETVTFNASDSYDPDGTIVSYGWDFGDGDTDTNVTTTHAYTTADNYTVTLTVTDNDTLTDIFTRNVTVSSEPEPPIASFTYSPATPTTSETVTFDASDSYDPDGTIDSYSWDFDDGSSDTGEIVTHVYDDDGTYTVTLTVTDDDGLSNATSRDVTVDNRPPNAYFTEDKEEVDTLEIIEFNATDSYDPDGTIASYVWDFGDNETGTGVVVTHAYDNNGTYTVTLTVTDNDGATDTATADKTVHNQPPVAAFTATPATAYINQTVSFDASTSKDDGTIASYQWDFGDGATATGKTTTHSYSQIENYTVTLTVTDDDGETNSTSADISVVNSPPTAVFTESADEVYTDEVISFDASDSEDLDGSIVSYWWEFGDETNATGIIVEHSYEDDGTYTVTLTVTDDDGATDTATATKTVLNREPLAIFTESAETAYVNESISFDASDSYDPDGTIAGYVWDFGDGANATGVIVNYAYETNGTFVVTLTVTDDDGVSNSSSSTKTILTNKSPVPFFTVGAVYTGEVVTFDASGSYDPDGNLTDLLWDFGDGSNASGVIVDHVYEDDGVYTVTLTITDDDGAVTSMSAVLTVLNTAPVALFTDNATMPLTREMISFNASDSSDPDGSVVSYLWDFGDGTEARGVAVSHAYRDDGNYTVTLTVKDDDGEVASKTVVKSVLNRSPVALFTNSNATVVEGSIRFDASSSYDPDGSILNYFWDFGDGANASMAVILDHLYAEEGNYTVTLTVTDDDGASSSVSSEITVKASSQWPLPLIVGVLFGIPAFVGAVVFAVSRGRKKSGK